MLKIAREGMQAFLLRTDGSLRYFFNAETRRRGGFRMPKRKKRMYGDSEVSLEKLMSAEKENKWASMCYFSNMLAHFGISFIYCLNSSPSVVR